MMSISEGKIRAIDIKPDLLALRVVKRRWYHGIMDRISKPMVGVPIAEIRVPVTIMCDERGNTFIKRRINNG